MFLCTACRRGITALNKAIVGRVSTEEQSYKAAKAQVRSIVDNICDTSRRLTKDPPVQKGCKKFVGAELPLLVKAFMPHVDVDRDVFEEPLDAYSFCSEQTAACPEGVLSFDELVGHEEFE